MANVIVYKKEDGGIDILRPAIKKPNNIDEITFLKTIAEKTFSNRKYTIESDEFIKKIGFRTFSEFRNALTLTKNGIDFDLEKCKNIWLNKIRKYRNKQLNDLDIEFMKSMEDGDTDAIKDIGELKKKLRELPRDFLKMKFPDIKKIQSYWPPILQPVPSFVLK